MKRLLLIALAAGAAACASSPASTATTPSTAATPGGGATGASSARAAVETFLASVRAQDVQATSAIWGTKSGPARDSDKMNRTQLEQRVLIMQCFLKHDRFRIVNDVPAAEGKRTVRVELTNAGRTRQTNFTTVEGPKSRWYVESADLEPVKEFCRDVPNPG
ncbi:MAG TPA: hypothetical protein VFS05_07120 [Gemmatimonadaceae bacterium]|nr:hypothetical protein [Gemmatimonadaceae bacterium]